MHRPPHAPRDGVGDLVPKSQNLAAFSRLRQSKCTGKYAGEDGGATRRATKGLLFPAREHAFARDNEVAITMKATL